MHLNGMRTPNEASSFHASFPHAQELRLCGSAGMPCLLAAAVPELFLDGPSLPFTELEFDFKGSMKISCNRARGKGFATIEIGGEMLSQQ
jgi:hypothetical protein